MTVDNTGSIALFLLDTISNIPAGVSGNLIYIADNARQYVENYCGTTISAASIPVKYQGAIVDFAKADTIDLVLSQAGGENISLGELSINETGEQMSSEQYRLLGEMKLKVLGRNFNYKRSLS